MSDKPLDQRSRRRLARTGIPQSIVRRDRVSQPDAAIPSLSAPNAEPLRTTTTFSSSTSDDSDNAPRAITTSVSVHTYGGELAKRARPCTSSSGGSDEQEDKRVKLTRLALPQPTECADSIRPSSPPSQIMPWVAIQTASDQNPLTPRTCSPLPLLNASPPSEAPASAAAPLTAYPTPPSVLTCANDGAESAMIASSCSQSTTQQESASWRKDSTSYVGLASPTQQDVPMRPMSPQPGTSYATATATPVTPGRASRPTNAPPQPAPPAPSQPTPRSTYPPLVVECLPHWTRHFQALGRVLGHAPNARPFGRGVRFLPKSSEEFRAVQRYMTEAAAQDSTISWYCYSPATEVPTKVAIRGLPLETPTEEVVAALCALGYPAEVARAIPPARGMHSCTYYVRLAHLTQVELQNLYATTELLLMPQVTIEAWRGGSKPPQCFRCQMYSHSSANCFRPIRCVRCAGEHPVRDCTRPRDEPPTCANCSQNHAANDRRCVHFKREARRRGIAQPPPPPRASTHRHQLQPQAPSTTRTIRNVQPLPDAAQNVAGLTTHASAPVVTTDSAHVSASASTTAAATRPTTLVADANPPTERGRVARGRRRKKNRAPRPARSEPTAASTPHSRQPRAAPTTVHHQMTSDTRDGVPTGQAPDPQAERVTIAAQPTPTADQVPPCVLPLHQPAQGEAQTNPDVMAIVRVVVEALITGLTAFLQGQGAIPALAAGMAVLTRLLSC